mgnify:CR=1 FL=1
MTAIRCEESGEPEVMLRNGGCTGGTISYGMLLWYHTRTIPHGVGEKGGFKVGSPDTYIQHDVARSRQENRQTKPHLTVDLDRIKLLGEIFQAILFGRSSIPPPSSRWKNSHMVWYGTIHHTYEYRNFYGTINPAQFREQAFVSTTNNYARQWDAHLPSHINANSST